MIGPLARSEYESPPPANEPDQPPSPPAEASAPKAPAAAPAPDAPKAKAVSISLEECAAITASIARRRDEEPKILDEHQIDSPTWESTKEHWSKAIRAETDRGKVDLLRRFDTAYVQQLEKERGPIQASEYARLMIATERGMIDELLADLTLPRGAVMRIERVWIEKMGKDIALGEQVREAVERLREAG
jgi:hypothetical protein